MSTLAKRFHRGPPLPERWQREKNFYGARSNDADSDDEPFVDGLKNFSFAIQEKGTNAQRLALLLQVAQEEHMGPDGLSSQEFSCCAR
eukprot:scaffold127461_cov26-Prasinocladus_malaysianus.AAC.3